MRFLLHVLMAWSLAAGGYARADSHLYISRLLGFSGSQGTQGIELSCPGKLSDKSECRIARTQNEETIERGSMSGKEAKAILAELQATLKGSRVVAGQPDRGIGVSLLHAGRKQSLVVPVRSLVDGLPTIQALALMKAEAALTAGLMR